MITWIVVFFYFNFTLIFVLCYLPDTDTLAFSYDLKELFT